MCECRIIFWSKTSSSISPFRYLNHSSNFAVLFNVLGTLPGQLFLDTLLDTCLSKPCLGTCSWEPCLGTCSWEPILRNLLLGALPGNLFLETSPACFKPVHWYLLGNRFFRNFAWEPLGTCPSEPCLGFCSCFQPCLQICFASCSWKSCSWEHEQPETMLGNVFVGTVLATYCSEPS